MNNLFQDEIEFFQSLSNDDLDVFLEAIEASVECDEIFSQKEKQLLKVERS